MRKRKKGNRTFYNRSHKKNRHHILAKSKNGKETIDNLILLDENRHAAYHLLFSNKTFKEAAKLLNRASRMKERQKKNYDENHEEYWKKHGRKFFLKGFAR